MALKLPEHDKLRAAKGANQTISNFLDWLDDEDYEIHVRNAGSSVVSKRSLIARFLGIDEKKFEAEKDLILRQIRKYQ